MSNNRARLRELGYSADAEGNIVCHREAEANFNRYLHERCGVIRIDIERDTKSTRELIERLIAAADEPRALVGRSRDGAVLLFRINEHEDLRHRPDDSSKLITSDGELFTITYGSIDQTVSVDAYSWPKGRSPLEVPRDSLAMLFDDIGKRVIAEALKSGASWAPSAAELERQRQEGERLARIREEIAAGLHTPEARQARQDEEAVAAHPDATASDGLWTQRIFEARDRIRARLKAAAERETA